MVKICKSNKPEILPYKIKCFVLFLEQKINFEIHHWTKISISSKKINKIMFCSFLHQKKIYSTY